MEPIIRPSLHQPCAYGKKVVARQQRTQPTVAEWHLWDQLRANRLANLHFRRQHIIQGFVVDFYCRSLGIAIEVDGPVHDQQKEYDQERDAILADAGIMVIRFTNEQVLTDIAAVLYKIEAVATEIIDAQSQNDTISLVKTAPPKL